VAYLLTGLGIAICSKEVGAICSKEEGDCYLAASARHVQFGLSVFSGLLLSLNKLMNPTQRCQQLKKAAIQLESIIWSYRTRAAGFEIVQGVAKAPEEALYWALHCWRERLMAGTDLNQTALKKAHRRRVFTHYQYEPPPPDFMKKATALIGAQQEASDELSRLEHALAAKHAERVSPSKRGGAEPNTLGQEVRESQQACEELVGGIQAEREWLYACTQKVLELDDFQSPVRPPMYIKLRLEAARQYYQSCIPPCSRWSFIWQSLLIFCSTATAVLSFSEETSVIPVVVTIGMSIASWRAFKNLEDKVTGYDKCVRQLEELLTWWASRGDIEKSSTVVIGQLVSCCEQIITMDFGQLLKEQPKEEKPGDAKQQRET